LFLIGRFKKKIFSSKSSKPNEPKLGMKQHVLFLVTAAMFVGRMELNEEVL
jgi:hypothetical protein